MAKKPYFYLGDPEFTKKMMKIYRWIMPFTFTGMFLVFAISKAWLTSLLFLLVAVIYIPFFKDFFAKFRLIGLLKAFVAVILIISAILSVNLYL